MKDYEVVFIFRPELSQDELDSELENIKKSVLKHDGKAEELKFWQKRELAYPIKKQKEGSYVLGHLKLSQNAPARLPGEWKLNPSVLRFLILEKEV